MELEWSRVFYSFYYFLGYLYWHLENIRQKIQIYSNALCSCTAIHVMSSKGFMNLAALKPYIPHWTLHNNVGINSTRSNPQGGSQRCRRWGTGKSQDHVVEKLWHFGVPNQHQQEMQHFSAQKIRPTRDFQFCVVFVRRGDLRFLCLGFSPEDILGAGTAGCPCTPPAEGITTNLWVELPTYSLYLLCSFEFAVFHFFLHRYSIKLQNLLPCHVLPALSWGCSDMVCEVHEPLQRLSRLGLNPALLQESEQAKFSVSLIFINCVHLSPTETS